MRKLLTILSLGLACAGCGSGPLGPNERQLLAQQTPTYAPGNPPNPWYLYDDSLELTGWCKGVTVWGDWWWMTINPSSAISPFSGAHCLQLTYDNTKAMPAGQSDQGWAGFLLIQVANAGAEAGTPGTDISAGGFTKCNFMLRMSRACTVSFAGDTFPGTQTFNGTTTWQACSIPLNAPATQTAVKIFLQVNNPSVMPTDVFIDDLRYQQ
jgi:hypothetical protein